MIQLIPYYAFCNKILILTAVHKFILTSGKRRYMSSVSGLVTSLAPLIFHQMPMPLGLGLFDYTIIILRGLWVGRFLPHEIPLFEWDPQKTSVFIFLGGECIPDSVPSTVNL